MLFISSFIRFWLAMSFLVYYLVRIWPHTALPSLLLYSWLRGGLVPRSMEVWGQLFYLYKRRSQPWLKCTHKHGPISQNVLGARVPVTNRLARAPAVLPENPLCVNKGSPTTELSLLGWERGSDGDNSGWLLLPGFKYKLRVIIEMTGAQPSPLLTYLK